MREHDQRVPSRIIERSRLGLSCGALGLFALMAAASLFLAGPQIEVDEGSYLLTAAALAGKLAASGVNGYYSGYSVLLLPAFLAGTDPERLYHGALIVNALLVATTPFALFRLTRSLFPDVEPRWHAGTAIAATCYASLLLISQHTMSESALVPLYAWLLAMGAEATLDARKSSALLCGAIAGLLFLVHPRGGLMAAAVLATLSGLCLRQRSLRAVVAALWIGALCIAVLHAPLEGVAGKPTTFGSAYSPDSVLARVLRPSAWPWIALNAFGALTEAVASSIGVVAIALAGLAADGVAEAKAGRWITPRNALVVAIAIGFGVGLLMSATFFIPPQRADQIAYGRYALPATVPLIALGLMRFNATAAARWRYALFALGSGLAAIGVLGLAFAHLPAATTKVWNYVNLPVLYIAQDIVKVLEHTQNGWWPIAAWFAASGCVLYAFAIASRTAGIAAYAALNVVMAAVGWVEITKPNAYAVTANRNVVAAAGAFESVTGTPLCADLSPALVDDLWLAIDMRWRTLNALSDTRRRDSRPCTHASIAMLEDSPQDDDRLIAVERRRPAMQGSIGLVVERGAALDAWKAKSAPVPRELLVPLPEGDRRAGVEIRSAAIASSLVVGDKIGLDVRVTNAGHESTWPSSEEGPRPILVGARTFLGEATDTVGEYRTPLPAPLAPGESASVHLTIGPFRRPGTYRVSVGIVQEFVAWFADTQDVTVQVSDR